MSWYPTYKNKELNYRINSFHLHWICFVPNCLFVTIIAKRTSIKTVYLYERRSAKLSSHRDAPNTSDGKRVTIPMISIILNLKNNKTVTHDVLIKKKTTITKKRKKERIN